MIRFALCTHPTSEQADITRLIKEYTRKRVLCIGDGGNDVSMIQAADVGKILSAHRVSFEKANRNVLGVGIVGKEGKQASLAADFSITQFSHLTRLLCKLL